MKKIIIFLMLVFSISSFSAFAFADASQVKPMIDAHGQCKSRKICLPPNMPVSTVSTDVTSKAVSQSSYIENTLRHSNLLLSLLMFLGFGLLLAFTPCVLPMVPILSGIITGQKRCTTFKAFKLSLVYVLSMSITYALVGVIAGSVGFSLQTMLQRPWIIAVMAAVFFVLALSMFGLFQIKLPARLSSKMNDLSNRQQRGSYIGVAVMGFLATLVVSPCVTPPLIGALTYITQSGDALLGGLALFMMGLGMGIPLIIIGTSNGALLPRVGQWMNTIKNISGVLLLVVVVWMLARILPSLTISFVVAFMLIVISIYMGVLSFKERNSGFLKFQHALSVVALIYGVSIFTGALQGNSSLWTPLAISRAANVVGHTEVGDNNRFIKVASLAALQNQLVLAKSAHKPAFVEFAADWCPDCQYMLHHTFTDPGVIKALNKFVLIRADITKDTGPVVKMMKAFHVIGPPVMFVYNSSGEMIRGSRLVGLTKAPAFLKYLRSLKNL